MLYHHPTQICDLFCKNMPEVSEATIEIRQKVRLKYFQKLCILALPYKISKRLVATTL